jgi:hypothetical protein
MLEFRKSTEEGTLHPGNGRANVALLSIER